MRVWPLVCCSFTLPSEAGNWAGRVCHASVQLPCVFSTRGWHNWGILSLEQALEVTILILAINHPKSFGFQAEGAVNAVSDVPGSDLDGEILVICSTSSFAKNISREGRWIIDLMHPWSSTSVDKGKEDTWGDTRVYLTHGLEMKLKPLQYPAVPAEMFFFSFSERCCSRKPDLLPQRLSLPFGEHNIWPVGLICCQSPRAPTSL